ncbi:MAG TPA: NAD(P)-dependent alcohol dehydrogenase [Steroidobacteraceae bacterium]|nr:NAD(P)-dependent alcohol dehydrogenase [Steroidobacteraceae bacterium]
MALPTTQKQYRLVRSGTEGPFTLELVDAPVRQPGPHEVLVRVHAVSLNRRDIFLIHGQYPIGPRKSLVPLSDGAGEVVAVGSDVTRFHLGDRVAAIFFQSWLTGRPSPQVLGSALGGQIDGMLSQYVTLNEQGLVALPASLSYEEGATLPCAGVTAWNGLVTRGRMQSGDFVLLEGTGGVSILGLQFAAAAGARPIITSSHDAKLEVARKLGAIGTVNYRTHPKWEEQVRELTGGVGVQEVLEVGGKDSLAHALASLGSGGHIALIGGLGGFGGDIPAMALMGVNATASGIYVGSRADFEAMNAFIEQHHVKPYIGRVFSFDEAAAAFKAMEADDFIGKIVIRM